MTTAEIALSVFAAFNTLRIVAYVPQIARIARDEGGATAISYTTWGLFAASHLSTVAYALLSARDWAMALVFVGNAACCAAIILLTALKRRQFRGPPGGSPAPALSPTAPPPTAAPQSP